MLGDRRWRWAAGLAWAAWVTACNSTSDGSASILKQLPPDASRSKPAAGTGPGIPLAVPAASLTVPLTDPGTDAAALPRPVTPGAKDGGAQGSNAGGEDASTAPGDSSLASAEAGVVAPACPDTELWAPEVYGNKVKSLLTGKALTAAELASLQADPIAIEALVDSALADEAADMMMQRFFTLAFQQDRVASEGLEALTNFSSTNADWGLWQVDEQPLWSLLVSNLQQSFARTALDIVRDGRPFSEVLTTDRFFMTTALKAFYSYVDHRFRADDGTIVLRPAPELDQIVVKRPAANAPSESAALDANSPDFLRLSHPGFDTLCVAGDEFAVPAAAFADTNGAARQATDTVSWLFARMLGRAEPLSNAAAGPDCVASARAGLEPLFTRSDFNDWQSVSVRGPVPGAEPVRFYELAALRTARELISHTERVGFFTTLGFFASWPTNSDNSLRVTLNQTLIAALGQGFTGVEPLEYVLPTTLHEYETPGNTCYDCHQTLGPLRDLLRSSFTTGYGEQQDPQMQLLRGRFSFQGVQVQDVGGASDLGEVLAAHPGFPAAWAQKLCHYANGQSCPEQSTEFQRVVQAFTNSGLDFGVLMRQLFASPLVTRSRCVAELPPTLPRAAGRESLCLVLSSRLAAPDICALQTPESERSELQRAVSAAVQALPSMALRRGQATPQAYATPTNFSSLATEAVCDAVGQHAFESRFGTLQRAAALVAFVGDVAGLPVGDARHPELLALLNEHVVDAVDAGATENEALRSALVLSCLSPTVVGVGL